MLAHRTLLAVLALTAMMAQAGDPAALRDLAQREGRVPLLVQLRVVGDSPSAAAIGRAADAVLADLQGLPVENLKRYQYVPMLGLTTDPEGLERLLRHPRVREVTLDGLAGPMRPGTYP